MLDLMLDRTGENRFYARAENKKEERSHATGIYASLSINRVLDTVQTRPYCMGDTVPYSTVFYIEKWGKDLETPLLAHALPTA